jgi:hypothetical protein
MGLPDPEAKIADLIKAIQVHMDAEEATLSKDPLYKGLFIRRV